MPDRRRLDDQEAAQRRRAWLQERHASARELVVVLLRHAPEAEVARVLDQLPAGDLQRLARLLAHAVDLQHTQDQDDDQDVAPPGRAGSSAVTPTHP
jgi:hypothetical protein